MAGHGRENQDLSAAANNELRRAFVVANEIGIHARPAARLAKAAAQFEARVTVRKDDLVADCKSILELMTLAAEHQEQVEVAVSGVDADAAMAAIADLFARNFEEDVK
jgi:phosphocarrier protein